MIPGRILHRLAATVCSAKTLERVVEPAIADLQKEHIGASASHLFRRARILLNGYGAILKVIAICALSVSVVTQEERRAVRSTLIWSCLGIVAATALLVLPRLSLVESAVSLTSAIQLLPQAVPLSIPIGVTFGIALGMSGRRTTRGTTKAVMRCALAVSLLSFAILVWAMPASNQAFKEAWARAEGVSDAIVKGPTEMTLSELWRAESRAADSGNARLANQYAWAFHLRFSLAAATVVLAGLFLAIAGGGAFSRALLALTACLTYWALLYLQEFVPGYESSVPAFARLWLPNIVFASLTVIIVSSRLRGSLRPAP